MTATLHARRWDVVVQARNGFYWASAVPVIVISALLLYLPESARANSAAGFVEGTPANSGIDP